jgi:hypothetical protein
MKKEGFKKGLKLQLHRETLRTLDEALLGQAIVGGWFSQFCQSSQYSNCCTSGTSELC